MGKKEAYKKIEDLVLHFDKNKHIIQEEYKEDQVRIEFINLFFEALG